MRPTHSKIWRTQVEPFRTAGDGHNGAYEFPHRGCIMRVVSSDGEGWDHVSVSLAARTPTWEEMDTIKDLFFDEEEAVMQLHPPRSQWINNHPYCLHLWRPQAADIPMPPGWMVGLKGLTYEAAQDLKEAGLI